MVWWCLDVLRPNEAQPVIIASENPHHGVSFFSGLAFDYSPRLNGVTLGAAVGFHTFATDITC